MSLLNDMLNDLNKNKQGFKSRPLSAFNHKPAFLRSLPDVSLWIIAPFVIGALLLLLITFHDWITRPAKPELPTPQDTTPIISTVPAIPLLPKVTVLPVPEPLFISEVPSVVLGNLSIPTSSRLANIDEDKPKNVEEALAAVEEEEIDIHKVFAPPTDTEWHDEQLNLALSAIQEGNDDPAEEILTRVLLRLPKAIVARETLATLYLAQERFDDARRILNDGLRFAPNAISLNTIKARLAFEQNHPQEALGILKQFKPNIHKNPDFYGLMAAILQSLGQVKEAGNLYKLLVEIEPGNGQYWLGYGIALELSKDKQQAITAYKTAAEHYDIEPAVRAYAENRLKTLQG